MRSRSRSLKTPNSCTFVKLVLLLIAVSIAFRLFANRAPVLLKVLPYQSAHGNTEYLGNWIWQAQKFRIFTGNLRIRPKATRYPDARKHARREPCSNWAVLIASGASTVLVHQLNKLPNWCTVIVENRGFGLDNENNSFVYQRENTEYLDMPRQKKLQYSILRHLSSGHISFKNIGYLYAIENGAKFIWDTDDSNILKDPDALTKLVTSTQKLSEEVSLVDGNHFLWNPHPYFKPVHLRSSQVEDLGWPRGFPIEYVKDESTQTGASKSLSVLRSDIGVYQSLADNEPDVDGVFRLTKDAAMNFA
eukprot:IDg12949t1